MGIRVPHKQCAKCKRFGHLKGECTPEVQMRASKCYNCGRFGHFSSRCTYRQVLDQPWSRPDRTLRPPPEPPLPPNPPAPPPPPCTQDLVPAPVYSWWPRGATLLEGSTAPEVHSVSTGNVTIENAPGKVHDEAPNEAPDKTPGPVREFIIDLTMYKGPHTGDYLSRSIFRVSLTR